MIECIKDRLKLSGNDGQFFEDEFKASMRNAMIKTGCCPRNDAADCGFEIYSESMVEGNKDAQRMACIPAGSKPPIIAVKGKAKQDKEALTLHNYIV